jgi:hypothetical protein
MPAPARSYGVLRHDARFHPASSLPVKPLVKMQLGSALHLLWIADLCTNCQLADILSRLLLFVMTATMYCPCSVADHNHKRKGKQRGSGRQYHCLPWPRLLLDRPPTE